MNTKNNRKSKMTRKIFQDTLLELLRDNHISEISVKGLCQAADLNRSTFYAYYQNQMDILREIEESTYADVHSFIMSGIHPDRKTESERIFVQLLNYIKEKQSLFLILLGQNGSADFQNKLMELTEQASDVRGINPAVKSSWKEIYVRLYRIAGCTRVIESWIRQGCAQPVEEMAKLLIALSAE